jgi:hypothetical protein
MEFDTSLPEGWQQSLPDDIRDSGVLADVKDISAIAKMAVAGRQLMSDHVRIPGESATPEARQEFIKTMTEKVPELVAVSEDMSMYDKLGRPASAEAYDLGEMPADIKDKFGSLTAKAHELGLTNKQMAGIAGTLASDHQVAQDATKAALSAERSAMKEAWGETYDTKLNELKHFAKQTGFTDDFVSAVGSGEIESANLKALDNVMGAYEGGVEIGNQPGDSNVGITPDQAEKELDEIMGNKDGAYYDVSNPSHKATISRVHELVGAAEAGKKQTESDEFRRSLNGG